MKKDDEETLSDFCYRFERYCDTMPKGFLTPEIKKDSFIRILYGIDREIWGKVVTDIEKKSSKNLIEEAIKLAAINEKYGKGFQEDKPTKLTKDEKELGKYQTSLAKNSEESRNTKPKGAPEKKRRHNGAYQCSHVTSRCYKNQPKPKEKTNINSNHENGMDTQSSEKKESYLVLASEENSSETEDDLILTTTIPTKRIRVEDILNDKFDDEKNRK
ncbi:hypothetical protein BB560_004898 [Smittium megazygosporum]|uniref:Uncharacterized protein n=1 Tax=Smittium megazygosporum TaxID=133381 RepID=A0A2T9Z7Y6_9FUNG|nr:hypothetical protein BB560_004898 [Smittium megazygosporum]